MLYDLKKIENDIIEYDVDDKSGKLPKKKAILSDNDELFNRYRFKHIAEVLEGIPSEFEHFV
jgi:syntaxin-binding protein 1